MELFIRELHALVARKKPLSPGFRIEQLYQLFDETVLDADTQVIFDMLAQKLQNGAMTEDEHCVLASKMFVFFNNQPRHYVV